MELVNEFRVAVPVDEAWTVLTDIERIAPCMPGAVLQEVDGDEFKGAVKVKVGPITAQYRGTATFQEKDEAARRAVLRAEGRETRGQGNASALVTAELSGDGEGTKVVLTTDLTISGRVAQFGRGVLADVSTKLLKQFVERLESDVTGAGAAPATATSGTAGESPATPGAGDRPAAGAGGASSSSSSSSSSSASANGRGDHGGGAAEPAAVDLLDTAGIPLAKRAAPIAALLAVAFWLLRRARRRS